MDELFLLDSTCTAHRRKAGEPSFPTTYHTPAADVILTPFCQITCLHGTTHYHYHNEYQFGDTSCATSPSGKLFYVCDVCFESQSRNYTQYSNCHAGSTAVTQRTGCDSKCGNCKAETSLPLGCQPVASVNTSLSLGVTDCSSGLVKFKKFTSTTCDEVVWEKVIPLQLCSGLRDNCRVWVV